MEVTRWTPKKSARISKPKSVSGVKRRRSSSSSEQRIATYVPIFRRINAPRNFTKLRMSMQGFVPGGVATTGTFQFTTCYLTAPFTSGQLFTAAGNGLGVTTGGTSLAQQYPGFANLTAQFQSYRIHTRSIKFRAIPSLAGDGISLAMYSSTNPNNAVALTYNNCMGQSRSAGGQAMFGSPIPTLYRKDHVANIVGMTREQWRSQDPTATGALPVSSLQFFDFFHWATIDGGALAGNLNFVMELEIEVEFNEPFNQLT